MLKITILEHEIKKKKTFDDKRIIIFLVIAVGQCPVARIEVFVLEFHSRTFFREKNVPGLKERSVTKRTFRDGKLCFIVAIGHHFQKIADVQLP